MSTQAVPPPTRSEPRGEGWVAFAIIWLALVGVVNIIYGIAALSNKSYFHSGSLLWSNLSTWAWVTIILGALQLLVSIMLYRRNAFGTIAAIFLASLSFIANFLAIGAYPAWSIIAMVLSGFVIWGVSVNMIDTA